MNADTANLPDAGIRKAAILVASLDPAAAETLLDQLDSEQAQRVGEAAAVLGPIDAEERQRVVDEFLRVGPMVPQRCPPGVELDGQPADGGRDGNSRGSWDGSCTAIPGATVQLSPQPGGEDTCPAADVNPPFRFLREAEGEKLARLLGGERPQTIALVLSHLSPQRAAGVLAHLPSLLQVEVIRRLVDLEETDPEVLREVERTLETRLSRQFAVQRRRVAGFEAVTGILDACDTRTGEQLLENLAACDRELAKKLSPRTVDFDELTALDDAAFSGVFHAAEPEVAQTALVGASPLLVERLLRTMAPKEAKRLRRKLNHPGPIRLSDVEDARRQIAALAQRMLSTNPNKPAFAA
jgi:flagellar motor switch protein FliG